jgi:hypothetical protein
MNKPQEMLLWLLSCMVPRFDQYFLVKLGCPAITPQVVSASGVRVPDSFSVSDDKEDDGAVIAGMFNKTSTEPCSASRYKALLHLMECGSTPSAVLRQVQTVYNNFFGNSTICDSNQRPAESLNVITYPSFDRDGNSLAYTIPRDKILSTDWVTTGIKTADLAFVWYVRMMLELCPSMCTFQVIAHIWDGALKQVAVSIVRLYPYMEEDSDGVQDLTLDRNAQITCYQRTINGMLDHLGNLAVFADFSRNDKYIRDHNPWSMDSFLPMLNQMKNNKAFAYMWLQQFDNLGSGLWSGFNGFLDTADRLAAVVKRGSKVPEVQSLLDDVKQQFNAFAAHAE